MHIQIKPFYGLIVLRWTSAIKSLTRPSNLKNPAFGQNSS
jgi:hypothetical protein